VVVCCYGSLHSIVQLAISFRWRMVHLQKNDCWRCMSFFSPDMKVYMVGWWHRKSDCMLTCAGQVWLAHVESIDWSLSETATDDEGLRVRHERTATGDVIGRNRPAVISCRDAARNRLFRVHSRHFQAERVHSMRILRASICNCFIKLRARHGSWGWVRLRYCLREEGCCELHTKD